MAVNQAPDSGNGVGFAAGPIEPTEDVKNFDESALVEKISSGFAAAFGDDETKDPTVDATDEETEEYRFTDEADTDTDEQEEEPSGSAVDDESEVDDHSVDDLADPSDAPTIPLAHERSLLANHTRDEIKQLSKTLGKDGFADYAARAHEKRNAETAQMAMFGRLAKDLSQGNQPGSEAAASQPHQPTQPQLNTTLPKRLEPVSVEALREKFGDDELIDTFATQMNAQAAILNQMMSQQQQSVEQLQQQEQAALARRIDEFFSGRELEAYKQHYGADASKLTPEQQDARIKVLEMADALSAGARYQGRILDVNEALDRAHAALSVNVSEATVREKIKKQAKQRNRGLTTRPGRSRASGQVDLSRSGQPQNEKELQARTRSRMKAVFG